MSQIICTHCSKPITRHWRKSQTLHFCNSSCNAQYRSAQSRLISVPAFERGELTNRAQITRILLSRGVPYECKLCGISNWMDKPITLNLDHIDGDSSNNFPNNFRFLCPNCDALSPFHKGKNRGRGRKSIRAK